MTSRLIHFSDARSFVVPTLLALVGRLLHRINSLLPIESKTLSQKDAYFDKELTISDEVFLI